MRIPVHGGKTVVAVAGILGGVCVRRNGKNGGGNKRDEAGDEGNTAQVQSNHGRESSYGNGGGWQGTGKLVPGDCSLRFGKQNPDESDFEGYYDGSEGVQD